MPEPHPGNDLASLRSWFDDEELKVCPYCAEKTAVPRGAGPSVCLSCEAVWVDDARLSAG
jgi:hypothetical protein